MVFVGFPDGTVVKNLPANQETWVRFLGWEDSLEKEMATHSSILVWDIPWTEEPGRLQSTGSQKSQTQLCVHVLDQNVPVWHWDCQFLQAGLMVVLENTHSWRPRTSLQPSSPQLFLLQGPVQWKTIFPWTRKQEDVLRMIQAHYLYCVLYFYYNQFSSTSNHQALDPGGWGPLQYSEREILEREVGIRVLTKILSQEIQ